VGNSHSCPLSLNSYLFLSADGYHVEKSKPEYCGLYNVAIGDNTDYQNYSIHMKTEIWVAT